MKTTSMMEHYFRLKNENLEHFLFYRVGDFYQLYEDDAKKISDLLQLTLTQNGNKIPMAGVPCQSVDLYITKLIKAGYSVAICDQITNPKDGPVVREITRIVTAGTLCDESHLDHNQLSLIGSLVWLEKTKMASLAIIELNSGRFDAYESNNLSELFDEVLRQKINELLISENSPQELINLTSNYKGSLKRRPYWEFYFDTLERDLCKHFEINQLDIFAINNAATVACGSLLNYVKLTQKNSLSHIKGIKLKDLNNYLKINSATAEHLELLHGQNDNPHTLLSIFGSSFTPMGLRLIAKWILHPKDNVEKVYKKHDAQKWFLNNNIYTENLANIFKKIGDIERITSRIGMLKAKPGDLIILKTSLSLIDDIKFLLKNSTYLLEKKAIKLDPLKELYIQLEQTLVDPAPTNLRNGGYIKPESNNELYHYWSLNNNLEQTLKKIEEIEKSNTQLSLSVGYNNVHGFYISLPRSYKGEVPIHYKRKQTLKNEERYTTDELDKLAQDINHAQNKIIEIEKEIYTNLLKYTAKFLDQLIINAKNIAYLDALLTMSNLGKNKNYTLPTFQKEIGIVIEEGRHPILEKIVNHFEPNSINIDNKNNIIILTGPNMGGKSTYMRQCALLVIMAYLGCFIPCKSMLLGPIDRIMTRIGARDELSRGRSTFMVEMIETAYILNYATKKSLVLMDEVGRGTSTQDGLAIAYAIAWHLLNTNKSLTVFATHYFELTKLENANNMHVLVKEHNNEIIFTHKIIPGCASDSYGIQVAKLAGIPEKIINKALLIKETASISSK